MNKKIILIIIVAIIIGGGFYLWGKAKQSQTPIPNNISSTCDVQRADFANYKISSDQFGSIDLKNGVYIQNDEIGNPDWKFTLSSNSLTYNFDSDVIKIIHIDNSHLSGSGAWDIALGYVCSGNTIVKVLEQDSISQVVINPQGTDQLKLAWGEGYNGANPPEKELTKIVQWNHDQFKFIDIK